MSGKVGKKSKFVGTTKHMSEKLDADLNAFWNKRKHGIFTVFWIQKPRFSQAQKVSKWGALLQTWNSAIFLSKRFVMYKSLEKVRSNVNIFLCVVRELTDQTFSQFRQHFCKICCIAVLHINKRKSLKASFLDDIFPRSF